MEKHWVRHGGCERLAIFVLGWAADAAVVEHIRPEGCDILYIYDFRDVSPLTDGERTEIDSYRERYLFAWSFGVLVAEHLFAGSAFTRAVAFNGTPRPLDNDAGIGRRRFAATQRGLQRGGMDEFNRRAYGDSYERLADRLSPRSLSDNIGELAALGELSLAATSPALRWDKAIVGRHDVIFPPKNMLNYWRERAELLPLPHYPFADTNTILREMNIDKDLIKERFESSFRTYNELAHVQRRICDRMAANAARICTRGVERAFEIGAGTGFLTKCLISLWPGAKWFLNDLTPACESFIAPQAEGADVEYLWGDAEKLDYPGGLDLIASTSTAQWFEDKKAFARKVSAALNPGGYLVLSMFGPENFREIRATTGEGLHYFPLTELSAIFEDAGFRILLADEYTETLSFETPRDALRYIKSLGVNSVKKTSWSSGKMDDFDAKYRELFPSSVGGVTLTYHPLLIIAERI